MTDDRLARHLPTSSSDREALRIGLVLDGLTMARFSASIIEDIQASDFANVEVVFVNDDEARRDRARGVLGAISRGALRGLALRAFGFLTASRAPTKERPDELLDCSVMLAGTRRLPIAAERGSPLELAGQANDLAELDVIVDLGSRPLGHQIMSSARYGVWRLRCGDPERYEGDSACVWEMLRGEAVTGVRLECWSPEADDRLILAETYTETDAVSFDRNRARAIFASTHMVIARLRELHAHDWPSIHRHARVLRPSSARVGVDRVPSNIDVARWALPLVARSSLRRAYSLITRSWIVHDWKMAVRVGDQKLSLSEPIDMRGFRWIEAPPGRAYADPFLLEYAGEQWLFFEEILPPARHGILSCAVLRADGSISEPQVVLQEAGHLSYPHVFVHEGSCYLIPESAAQGSVRLLKATDFPTQWELETVLYDAAGRDTTAWHESDKWWFFTTLKEPRGGGTVLMLFYSDTLTGPWTSHPRNPISTDVRNSRCAGAIFRRDGRLVRPSQDCSRTYGYSFSLNEIVIMTATEYEERQLLTVAPDWGPDLDATHTYATSGWAEATDGRVQRTRRAAE